MQVIGKAHHTCLLPFSMEEKFLCPSFVSIQNVIQKSACSYLLFKKYSENTALPVVNR